MKKPTQDEFAKLMMDRVRQAGENSEIRYDPDEFRLHGKTVMYLGNAYAEYCGATGDKREKILRQWARNWFTYLREFPEEFEDAKHDLMPIVRSRWHFESLRLQGEVEKGVSVTWPHQVLGEHFGIGLVYDLPACMQSFAQIRLDKWGVTFYEALEVALEDLMALPSKFIGPPSGEGVYFRQRGTVMMLRGSCCPA